MRSGVVLAGLVGVMVLSSASHALAQAGTRTRAPAVSLAEAQSAQRSQPAPQRRGLRWNENGRWGLNFNMNQPVGRETSWGDVEAGAFYSLNPRLSVGASAGLGTLEQDPARAPETDRRSQPRVRLQSIFKF